MIQIKTKLVPKRIRNYVNFYFVNLHWKNNEKDFIKMRLKDINSVPVPHNIKAETIKYYAKMFQIKNFIETGTFLGKMTIAVKDTFENIISIELSDVIYERAVKLFAKYPHISIKHGDSGSILPIVLQTVNQPCMFWLDGHYSGGITAKADIETPIISEIKTILNHPVKNHVILIDDARLFIGSRDYPTLDQVKKLLSEFSPDFNFEVKDDIIIIYKKTLAN
jgi:hypothetical protein